VATATGIAMAVDLARLPVYLVVGGAEIVANWEYVAVGVVGVVAGTLLATPILRRLPELAFRRFVFALITMLGVLLIVAPGG
jgi:uncharacterized membrane protein YfcA